MRLKMHKKMKSTSSKKPGKMIHVNKVPRLAKIVNSHVIYKIKVRDDQTLSLKASFSRHTNEDSLKEDVRRDCSMCAPSDVCSVLSIATIFKWKLPNIHVKGAFLQTDCAQRDFYVLSPIGSSDKDKLYWLIHSDAYVPVNKPPYGKHNRMRFSDTSTLSKTHSFLNSSISKS